MPVITEDYRQNQDSLMVVCCDYRLKLVGIFMKTNSNAVLKTTIQQAHVLVLRRCFKIFQGDFDLIPALYLQQF